MAETAASGRAAPRRIAERRTLDIDAMTEAGRRALAHDLFPVHAAVFAGLDEAEFFQQVFSLPAERTVLQLYLDESEDVVGYCAVHRFRRRLRNRDAAVIRAEAGLLPAFRGRGSTYWFGMVWAFWLKLRHPAMPLFYLDTLVHPSSYHLFCKYFRVVYPRPGLELPEPIRDFAAEVTDSFEWPVVDPSDPMIRKTRWITVESPQETRLSGDGTQPDVRYFQDRNPGYRQGHGLVVVVPLTFSNLLGALARRAAEALRHRFRHRPPPL